MSEDWQPPEDAKVHIVCAAIKRGDHIITGPRHFDDIMRMQVKMYGMANGDSPDNPQLWADWDQGFVDQFCRYYSREDALAMTKKHRQPVDFENQSGVTGCLFSEGLY